MIDVAEVKKEIRAGQLKVYRVGNYIYLENVKTEERIVIYDFQEYHPREIDRERVRACLWAAMEEIGDKI